MTRDDIIRMAREAGINVEQGFLLRFAGVEDDLERFAVLVAAAEREACAKVCDGLADIHEKMNQWGQHKTAETLAQAIRARGQA
jgi:5,10-methylenetetrahydrofolate reductase